MAFHPSANSATAIFSSGRFASNAVAEFPLPPLLALTAVVELVKTPAASRLGTFRLFFCPYLDTDESSEILNEPVKDRLNPISYVFVHGVTVAQGAEVRDGVEYPFDFLSGTFHEIFGKIQKV